MENFQIIIFSFFTLNELIILVFSIYYFAKTKSKEGILLLIGSSLMVLSTAISQLLNLLTFFSESNSMVRMYNIIIVENMIQLTGMIFFTFGFVFLVLKQLKTKQ